MASKIKVALQKQEVPAKDGSENPPDCSPLDRSNAAVEEVSRSAKKHGYVAVEQINSVLPSRDTNSGQINDILSFLEKWA